MNKPVLSLAQLALLRRATSSLSTLTGVPVRWQEGDFLTISLGASLLPAWIEVQPVAASPHNKAAVLITPYVTGRQAEQLRQAGQHFLDGEGNAYLRTATHSVFIQGRPRSSQPSGKPQPALPLLPPTGLRLLYYLLSKPELLQVTYRKLSELTNISLGSVHTFFSKAQQQYLVQESGKGWRWVAAARALESWMQGYEQVLRPRLEPRRYRWLSETGSDWRQLPLPGGAYWSGEVGAHLLLGERHLVPTRFTLFSPHIPENWGLVPDPLTGTLDLLLPPFALPAAVGTIPPLLTYSELRLAQGRLAQDVLERQLPHLR